MYRIKIRQKAKVLHLHLVCVCNLHQQYYAKHKQTGAKKRRQKLGKVVCVVLKTTPRLSNECRHHSLPFIFRRIKKFSMNLFEHLRNTLCNVSTLYHNYRCGNWCFTNNFFFVLFLSFTFWAKCNMFSFSSYVLLTCCHVSSISSRGNNVALIRIQNYFTVS